MVAWRTASLRDVGKRVDIEVGHEWDARTPGTQIVVIGAEDGMDETALRTVFDDCLA